jgi:hypothetical protein
LVGACLMVAGGVLPLALLAAVTAVAGLFSAFLVNDAICLVLAPLVLELTLSLRLQPGTLSARRSDGVEHPVRPQLLRAAGGGERHRDKLLGRSCQVNLSRSEKLNAACAITLRPPHSAIRSPPRLERFAALIARRDDVEG